MTELNFKLEVFEGPLDLMLMLIQKHKLNIQDIEITILLDQFMIYLERMTEADIEVTADFLEMAARLILIKSAALLPKEEAEQMKRELQGALIELALCKTMAGRLKRRFQGDTIFVREPVKIDIDNTYRLTHQPEEILLAYSAISERSRRKASFNMHPPAPVVEKSYVTVFTGVFSILKSLRQKAVVPLAELYEGQPRSRKVATFLAVLELSKDGRIIISEDGASVRLATAEDRARALAALQGGADSDDKTEDNE
ncbi:MAG: segregation/condensation protein A [Oscillospiraceae bacterium]|nr:segregation/condensation protein A [Oscillospiraceae bacterium]